MTMQTISVEEAQSHLGQIIDKLAPGEEVVLTRDHQPVARIVREAKPPRPGPGLCKGMIAIVSDDEEHLKDFAGYMAPDFNAPLMLVEDPDFKRQ
jgi:antitoxin (DNA-binding transcriptional repressor) of toxin-antitoxin stability system